MELEGLGFKGLGFKVFYQGKEQKAGQRRIEQVEGFGDISLRMENPAAKKVTMACPPPGPSKGVIGIDRVGDIPQSWIEKTKQKEMDAAF